MEVDEAIRRLRVVRRFTDERLAADVVESILNAARRTGSSKNVQSWHFIVVEDRERLAELAKVGMYADHLAGATVAIALLTPDPASDDSAYSLMWDLGRAAQNMVLTAWAHAVGSAPATVYDQPLCRRLLEYPADWHCAYILSFGYPAETEALTRPLRAGGRRALAEMVSYETWSGSGDS